MHRNVGPVPISTSDLRRLDHLISSQDEKFFAKIHDNKDDESKKRIEEFKAGLSPHEYLKGKERKERRRDMSEKQGKKMNDRSE